MLAVDWGSRRFGVALSDPSRMIAQPLTTLTRRPKQRAPVAALCALVAAHGVTQVVVGLPLTSEGNEEDAAGEARALGAAIAARALIPVDYLDERMTTARALSASREAGIKRKELRARVDQMAAVGILQAWLDRQAKDGGSNDRGIGGSP